MPKSISSKRRTPAKKPQADSDSPFGFRAIGLGHMKNIDVKSLLIGVLATALLFACADADKASPSIVSEAKAAEQGGAVKKKAGAPRPHTRGITSSVKVQSNRILQWDINQQWEVKGYLGSNHKFDKGWEPFAVRGQSVLIRRRVN